MDEVTQVLDNILTLENEYLNCIYNTKISYNIYKNDIEAELFSTSKKLKKDLNLFNLYLKKHNELKEVYSSYKIILKELSIYKKRMNKLIKMPKTLISNTNMKILLKDQDEMKNIVNNINQIINNKK